MFMRRDMTEDELRKFEAEELHQEKATSGGGSASDEELVRDQDEQPSGDPEMPMPNPD
jgi:hypothetical protein